MRSTFLRLVMGTVLSLAVAVSAAACGSGEAPVEPGTPPPFSSPGASPDGPPLPP